jgi:hypothetical protein
MNILIRPLTLSQGNRWQVRLDQHSVTFRTESEARNFVATLETRLKAPHCLPNTSQFMPAEQYALG